MSQTDVADANLVPCGKPGSFELWRLAALVPVAAQAVPGLPERGDLVVVVGLCTGVGASRGDEGLLVHAVAHTAGPAVELDVEAIEVLVDVLVQTEVDQREPFRLPCPNRLHRFVPDLDVDVRGR